MPNNIRVSSQLYPVHLTFAADMGTVSNIIYLRLFLNIKQRDEFSPPC